MYVPVTNVPNNSQNGMALDFSSNVMMSDEMLIQSLSNINALADRDAYSIIKEYYENVLNIIFDSPDKNLKTKAINIFTIPKFIIAMTQVMYTINPNHQVRRRLNKMCYDYLVLESNHHKDEYVSGLLMTLSKTVNRDKIPVLCAVPLSEDLASLLALARYSSEKDTTNVKRLNRVLMNQPLDAMSEQKIIDIYLALFDHVLPLFTGVMLDVVSPQTLTESSGEIYGLITLAALDIIEELPMADIRKGLILFDQDRKMQYPDSPLRINLESCSESDYPRLLKAIDALKAEGVYISTF